MGKTEKDKIYCEKKREEVTIIKRWVKVNSVWKAITNWECEKQNFCDNFDCPNNNSIYR